MQLSGLLESASLKPARLVRQALSDLGLAPRPLAVLAAASGQCPLVYFSPALSAQELVHLVPEGDPLAALAEAGGATTAWTADTQEARQALESGAQVLCPWSSVERLLVVRAAEQPQPEPKPGEILRRIVAASEGRTVAGREGPLDAGPAAVQSLRRALARASQGDVALRPRAAGWLGSFAEHVAAQLFLAGQAVGCLHGEAPGDRGAKERLAAAAGNFDCAAAYVMTAHLVAGAPGGQSPALDASHWGVVYDALRQAEHHWRWAGTRLRQYLELPQSAC